MQQADFMMARASKSCNEALQQRQKHKVMWAGSIGLLKHEEILKPWGKRQLITAFR